jgi:hypothetical protein
VEETGLCNWTPIGAGLAAAQAELAQMAEDKREQVALLINDGRDNCDGREGYTTESLPTADASRAPAGLGVCPRQATLAVMAERKRARSGRRTTSRRKGVWGVVLERASGYVDLDGQPMRPWLALWIDLSAERDLAIEMAGERTCAVTAAGYERALDAAGCAPTRVLAPDEPTRAALEGAVPPGIPVAVGRQSQLAAIAATMAEAATSEAAASESLLTTRRVAEVLKVDFAAAAAEYLAWTRRWPLEGGFLVIEPSGPSGPAAPLPTTVAGLGPHASLLLLDSVSDLVAATSWQPGGPPPTIPHGEIHVQPRDAFPPGDWKELSRRGLCLPGDQVADLMFTDADHIIRPLCDTDARRATAALRAAAAWLLRDAAEPDMEELSLELEAGGLACRVRVTPLEGERESDPAVLGLVREPDGKTYQLKITIEGSRPPIWRRVRVPGSITLAGLHEVIQRVMGWEDYHLHQFELGSRSFGPVSADDPRWAEATAEDEAAVRLDEVIGRRKGFTYTYDFGDDWVHHIAIEEVGPSQADAPLAECTGGEGACPPEDSGGIHGYYDLLERARGRGRAARDARDWLGDHDPDRFDLAEVNSELADLT